MAVELPKNDVFLHRFKSLNVNWALCLCSLNCNMVTYHSNGYSMAAAPLQNYSNNRPQNVRKSGKHEDAEEGKLFVGGLRFV